VGCAPLGRELNGAARKEPVRIAKKFSEIVFDFPKTITHTSITGKNTSSKLSIN
jgi:hypothetical protein